MKKYYVILLIGVLFISAGCLSRGNQKKSPQESASAASSFETTETVIPGEDGMVSLKLTDGHGKAVIRHEKDKTVYVAFQVTGYKMLHGQLTSDDPDANIRFSQISMPDGSADGPFGREIDYELKSEGTYKLSVHENMMAGDPWEGVFTVEITLK